MVMSVWSHFLAHPVDTRAGVRNIVHVSRATHQAHDMAVQICRLELPGLLMGHSRRWLAGWH